MYFPPAITLRTALTSSSPEVSLWTNPAAPDTVKDHFKKLDPTKTIWDVADPIDYWFSDSPSNITIKQKKGSGSSAVVKRALRQAACDDPNVND